MKKISFSVIIILQLLLFTSIVVAEEQDFGIVGLQDFQFASVTTRDTNIVSKQNICVYNLKTDYYNVTVTGSTNKKGQLVISNRNIKVPVTVKWGTRILKPKVPLTMSGAAKKRLETCANAGKVELKLTLHPNKNVRLIAGKYDVDLHFELTPR